MGEAPAKVSVMTDGARTAAWARACVLGSAVILMLPGASGHSVTAVEFSHLPAGLAAWQRHALAIYRVCGPVSKLLYALPAHLAGVRVDHPASLDADVLYCQEWNVGKLFQAQNSARYHEIFRWSRLLPILVTVVGGCLICEWSTRLFGIWPGVASLCLWCGMPPVLAHGSLVTSDVLSAVLLVWAARAFWSFLLQLTAPSALLAGLPLGLAAATKFTLLILYPCWGLLVIGRALQRPSGGSGDPSAGRGSLGRLVGGSLVMFAISLVVIDGVYMFKDVGFRLSQWNHQQSALFRGLGRLAEGRATAGLWEVPLPIPLEFVRGLDFQLADSQRLQAGYLLGESRTGGWWYWYWVATLFKVPLPALALMALALVRTRGSWGASASLLWATLCVLLPAAEAALMISATTGTGTNAAFRYLIPSLALLCVWSGQVFTARPRLIRWGAVGLLGWLAVNAVLALPDHLGWQNEVGRLCSRHRPALLGDSLDWGQDLARLGAWVARHSAEGMTRVCVFGLGGGEPYGLVAPAALPASQHWEGATYVAVSANVLFGYEVAQGIAIGGHYARMTPEQRDFLLSREPCDRVGRTIRIYKLGEAEGPSRPAAAPASLSGESAHAPLTAFKQYGWLIDSVLFEDFKLSSHDAHDARQDVYLAMAAGWNGRRQTDERATEAWIRTIVRRIAGDLRRRSNLRPQTGFEQELFESFSAHGGKDATLDGVIDTELQARMALAVGDLPEPIRQAVMLRFESDMTIPEIAEALGCSPRTVTLRLERALRTLRRVLDANGSSHAPKEGGRRRRRMRRRSARRPRRGVHSEGRSR
jgi:RNA polymerase sigma factor (sigma-70 family)